MGESAVGTGLLQLGDAAVEERTYTAVSLGVEDVEENTRHMVRYALGGLAAIAGR